MVFTFNRKMSIEYVKSDVVYYLKDHLGNIRVTIDEDGEIVITDDYYPFGLQFNKLGDENKFTYNGKEFEDDLNWYHYDVRYYDPQLGRWHSIDPLDEFWNPYCYVGNKPIISIDPDGMDELRFNQGGEYVDPFDDGKKEITGAVYNYDANGVRESDEV